MSNVRALIIVKGLVQGVGYRWFVERHAKQLGLTGYVHNLPDGNVEVVVEGARSLIEELIRELKVGPRFASVEDVRVTWHPYRGEFNDFRIRFW